MAVHSSLWRRCALKVEQSLYYLEPTNILGLNSSPSLLFFLSSWLAYIKWTNFDPKSIEGRITDKFSNVPHKLLGIQNEGRMDVIGSACQMGKTWRNKGKEAAASKPPTNRGKCFDTTKVQECNEFNKFEESDYISFRGNGNGSRKKGGDKNSGGLFFIDTGKKKQQAPSKEGNSGNNRSNPKTSSGWSDEEVSSQTSTSQSIDSGSSSNSGSSNSPSNSDFSSSNNTLDESDSGFEDFGDKEFAQLVQEYKTLMSIDGGEKGLEWSLDEMAAKLLRERKASNPKYSKMSQEEFDQILQFDEVYGKKSKKKKKNVNVTNGASFKDRLRKAERNTSRTLSKHSVPENFVNFKQLNRDIKEFVRNEDVGEEMEIESYPPMIRKLIHELAHVYGLDSKSQGQGADRHCILVKGHNTRLPRDLKRLDKFLERAQKSAKYAYGKQSTPKSNEKATNKTKSAKAEHGSVVGAYAPPIEEHNIGNMMLRKLGWLPGNGLGADQEGRKDPVEAIYRKHRTGLGS